MTETAAYEWLAATRGRVVEARAARKLTVEEYARRWLGEFVDTAVDMDRYRRDVVGHVLPALGARALVAVTPAEIADAARAASGSPMGGRMSTRAPGAFCRDHPCLYALSLAGALGVTGYATAEARKAEPGRARWWALAALTATQAVGMAASRRRARTAGDGDRPLSLMSTR